MGYRSAIEIEDVLMPTDRDLDAERRTAISAAEAIMHDVLGYMPDEPGDARIIRERIQKWLVRDIVRWQTSRR